MDTKAEVEHANNYNKESSCRGILNLETATVTAAAKATNELKLGMRKKHSRTLAKQLQLRQWEKP